MHGRGVFHANRRCFLSTSISLGAWPSCLAFVCRITVRLRLDFCAAYATEVAAAEGEVAPQKTKEELEAQQEEQLNALRVLYAAQHAVKHANESCGTAPCGEDPKPKFDELMKNITFPKSGGFLGGDGPARKKAIDSVILNEALFPHSFVLM